MVAQNVLIWAAPLHNIEKSLGVPNGGYFAGQNARRGARPAPIWPARHNR
jgi:hypothetical protein